MTKFIATNSGPRAQIIRIAGGTITLKSGQTIDEVEPKPDLDDALKDHYRKRGVTFSVAERGKGKKAAVDAAAAIKAAEDAVAAAKAKFEAAGDDMVAKAAAGDELKAAEAALAGLKG